MYSFAVNGVEFSSSSDMLFNETGTFYATRLVFNVKGYLLANTASTTVALQQADLTQQENLLKTALSLQYGNLNFYQDSGAVSADFIVSAVAVTGVRCTHLVFPKTRDSEYATQRTFEAIFEAELPVQNAQNIAMNFTETLTYSGGGPLYIFKRCVNGVAPVKQLVFPQTEYICTQSGIITGYKRRINPPPSKFPQALMYAPQISPVSPRRRGPNGYTDYAVSYSYHHESAAPFGAVVPTVWTGTGYA